MVGDVKVRIAADEEEDVWDDIVEDPTMKEDASHQTIDDVVEDYIEEDEAI